LGLVYGLFTDVKTFCFNALYLIQGVKEMRAKKVKFSSRTQLTNIFFCFCFNIREVLFGSISRNVFGNFLINVMCPKKYPFFG